MVPRLRPLLAIGIAAAASALLPPSRAANSDASADWSGEAAILKRMQPPVFPSRAFPITDFGAAPGGRDCTAAIAEAIAACHAAGGGHVIVPAGIYSTGGIRLLSGVDLHLADGATLKFAVSPAAYLPVVYTRWEGTECMNYQALIYAFGQENIAVTGRGTLDGSAGMDNWWGWTKRDREGGRAPFAADALRLNELADAGAPVSGRVFGAGHHLRPNFIQTYRCKGVLIEGVSIVRSPMWEIHPCLCSNVTIRGVRISSLGPNNDGCDPESCRDLLIEGCSFDTGDDCIVIKSGRNDDGRRINVPAENLVIRGCVMRDGHAGVAVGSEISGGCRNVFIEDCTMDGPKFERVLRLKSNARRGGTIENIYMRDIRVGRVEEAVVTVDFLYEEGARGSHPPVVRNVFIDHLTATGAPRVFYVTGFAGATIDRIRISHSTIAGIDAPEVIEHAGRITLDDVAVVPAHPGRSLSSRGPAASD